MPRITTATTVLAAAVFAVSAHAQPADLTVQPGQSSVEAQLCLTPPGLSTECDTDSSGLAGTLSIELDDYAAATAITLHDFVLLFTDPLNYNMDWGFFIGGVDIQLVDVVVSYATPGTPAGPVAVDGVGDFEFPVVQAIFTGTGSYQGYGPIMEALVGSGTFNLADFGVVESALAGNVTVANDQITLAGAQAFSDTGDIDGTATSIDGTATLVAIGDVPDQCRADINGDGEINTQDFLAYLNLWTAGDAGADFDGNGTVNTQDFLIFLNEWTAGC